MAKTGRTSRIAAMLTLLALPSCVTIGLWGDIGAWGYTDPLAIHVTQTCVLRDADGTLQRFALQIADEDGPLGAQARGKWLLLDLWGRWPNVSAFFAARARGDLDVPEFTIALESWDGRPTLDHATLVLQARVVDSERLGPDLTVEDDRVRVSWGTSPEVLDHAPDATTPFEGGAPRWSTSYLVVPPVVVIGKVVLTPLTVAADVVTLPVQLVLARR